MAALTRARRAALVAALILPLALIGCVAPANPSTVTVTFDVDGSERSVTLRPDVTCAETGVHGSSIGETGPGGQFSFLDRSLNGTLGTGSGAIEDGPGLILFDAAEIELVPADGVVDVAETAVTVLVFADRAESGPEFDDADGEEVDGILTAHLVCTE